MRFTYREAAGVARRSGGGLPRVHTLVIRLPHRRATIQIESEDVALEVSEEDLAAFNSLVQDGLIEVVMIEDGMPYLPHCVGVCRPA
jgi:hypothetical protein